MTLSYYKVKPLIVAVIVLSAVISHFSNSFLTISIENTLSIEWVNDLFLLSLLLPPLIFFWVFLSLYNEYLWKCPVCCLLVTVPNLNGVYEGEVNYSLNGKEGIKRCTLKIKQNASHIDVICNFDKDNENQTTSASTFAQFKADGKRSFLYFYYHNQGSGKNNDTLNQHDGFCFFEIKKEQKNTILDGRYFTNRDPQTQGILRVSKNR